MKSLIRYIIFALSVSLFEARKFRCDYQYFRSAEGWFKIHTAAMLWSDAAYTCSMEGAELATPSTNDIKDAMMSLMYDSNDVTTIHTARHPKSSYGGFSEESEALALTADGIDMRVSQRDYYPFICYKKAGEDVLLNECGTLDKEYVLYNRTGHCYKFHSVLSSWYKARRTCDIEGGWLAIINSDDEAQVIREVIAKHPSPVVSDFNDMVFVGIYSIDGVNWKTLDGESLVKAGYGSFFPGEPNNARGDEYCGSVGRDGLLFDDPCTRRFAFICERRTRHDCDVTTLPERRFGAAHRRVNKLKFPKITNNYILNGEVVEY